MRKFRLRAAFAASLLRDLCLGCAWAVSWPFRFAASGFDLIARPSGARQAERRSPEALTDAVRDVLAERRRQIEVEGWTPEHDDYEHEDGDLSHAAACYLLPFQVLDIRSLSSETTVFDLIWPWSLEWWKPKSRRHDLVRAGALILAEIERLDRAAASLVAGR